MTNTRAKTAYKQIDRTLEDQIDYRKDQQAAVALIQFLEVDQKGSKELDRIKGEIFIGDSLKTMLEASVGELVNTENVVQMVQGYLKKNIY